MRIYKTHKSIKRNLISVKPWGHTLVTGTGGKMHVEETEDV